jgi:hypothetical protein
MPTDAATAATGHPHLCLIPKFQLNRGISEHRVKPFERISADFVPVNSQPIFHPAGDLLYNRDLIFS